MKEAIPSQMGRLPRIRQQLGKRERHTRPRAHSRVLPLQGITPQLYKHLDTNVQILIFGYTNQSYNHSLPTTSNFTIFIITPEYNSVNNNNKRPHVASDSSSSYSESEISVASSRFAPSSSPDLFYLETTQLPPPMALGTKTLQFGTTETVPTVLFKDRQHLEDGEIPSQSEPLIPGSPLTSKAPAQVQVKVEHFEAITNAREAEAKTDVTTDTSTITADHKRSDLFFELLRSYSGPVTLSALDACANPFRTGANKHHLCPDAQDKPRPADLTREYCPRCKHTVLPRHNDACKKEQLRQLAEERLQATADRIEDALCNKLHQRPQSCIPISTYKRCHKCYKVGHICAQCSVGKHPWNWRNARK